MDPTRQDMTRPNDPHAASSEPIVLEMGEAPAPREWCVRYRIDRDLTPYSNEDFVAVGDPELCESDTPQAYWMWTDGEGNVTFMLPADRLIYAASEPAHASVKVEPESPGTPGSGIEAR